MAKEKEKDSIGKLTDTAYNLGGAAFLRQRWAESRPREKGIDEEALALVRQRYRVFETEVATIQGDLQLGDKVRIVSGPQPTSDYEEPVP